MGHDMSEMYFRLLAIAASTKSSPVRTAEQAHNSPEELATECSS